MKITVLSDLIDRGNARWWHYIRLTFWVAEAAQAYPQFSFHCRQHFEWLYNFFNWLEEWSGIPNPIAFLYESANPLSKLSET